MDYRIEVVPRDGFDTRARDIVEQVQRAVGLSLPGGVEVSTLYFIRGQLDASDLEQIADELLVDQVVETYRWRPIGAGTQDGKASASVEVGYRPGVTDPVAAHLLDRVHLLGIGTVEAVATGTRYTFKQRLSHETLSHIATSVLCNEVIETYEIGSLHPAFVPAAKPSSQVDVIPLRRACPAELDSLSRERVLFLSSDEMRAIQSEFRRLGRDPTDVELETLAQTWSEHCQHKTFKADIRYAAHGGMSRLQPDLSDDEPSSPESQVIPGLLKTYIRGATEKLAKPWVRSAFVDNAGIVDYVAEFVLAFKVETHNHPSALEPFGGANTGVGGVIRDVIGVSSRPIANTDVLCFGSPDMAPEELPAGTLHPRRIARGVIAGIEDYGNKMGIPTVSGAILYDRHYAANPLVFCGCVGLAEAGQHKREAQPGDLCVALGGRTGRDGLHGATFSSAELTHETGDTVGTVVQIGDPITEKALLEAVMEARDEGLYTAITDCGAGGFSSAVGEMGQDTGVDVELSNVPLKYPGLRPWEIWLSEAQERMVLAVPPEAVDRLQAICDTWGVEMTIIGQFTSSGRLMVRYEGRLVADLGMGFLHNGWVGPTLKAEWRAPDASTVHPDIDERDLTHVILSLLAHPDVASKEQIIRRYDHEVQGATVVKPLVGPQAQGPSDGAVLSPLETLASGGHEVPATSTPGIALACGICPHYAALDPYAMAWAAVGEAMRNVVAVGADPDRVALLDNFCWGNPSLPDRLGSLVRASQGCHDAALTYGAPFVSGKDSLNNDYLGADGAKHTIPPTLMISALGIVPEVQEAVTADLKSPGNPVYLLGVTRPELGGSLLYRLFGGCGGQVPAPVADPLPPMRALHTAVRQGLVRACHDLAEGGLAVALAEMAIAGDLGLRVQLRPSADASPTEAQKEMDQGLISSLFSESAGRFLVEVSASQRSKFERVMEGLPCQFLGEVTNSRSLCIEWDQMKTRLDLPLSRLRKAWLNPDLGIGSA